MSFRTFASCACNVLSLLVVVVVVVVDAIVELVIYGCVLSVGIVCGTYRTYTLYLYIVKHEAKHVEVKRSRYGTDVQPQRF